jgi:hypothetical protein
MVAVEKRIWKLRAVISYEQPKKLKMEKSYFGITIAITFVRIAINGSTIILSWILYIKSVPNANIKKNLKSIALGAKDTFAVIVMTVFKLIHFNYTITSYLFENI